MNWFGRTFVPAIFALAGLGSIVLGILMVGSSLRLAWRGVATDGVVLASHPLPREEGTIPWYHMVAFTDQQGNRHVFADRSSSSEPNPVGSPKRVLYDPADPEIVEVISLGGWLARLVPFLIGTLMLKVAHRCSED